MSQDIENQQMTSLKYTVITPRLCKMSENTAFGMLVAGNSVKRVVSLFHCSRFVVHNDVRRYNLAGNTTDALWPA